MYFKTNGIAQQNQIHFCHYRAEICFYLKAKIITHVFLIDLPKCF